jgi:hypothetical protein
MADNPVQFPAVAALPVAALPVEDAAQNVNLPEDQNPPQGQNAPAADQNANAAGQPLEVQFYDIWFPLYSVSH